MKLLLLFVSCVSLSKAYDRHDEVEYGKTHRFYMTNRAYIVEFIPQYSYDETVLWKRDEPHTTEGKKWSVTGNFFSIFNITHKDSGEYRVLDKTRTIQLKQTINVYFPKRDFFLKSGERLYLSANVETTSCNIFFVSSAQTEIHLVHRGKLLSRFKHSDCDGLYFTPPCQLANDKTESSCSGHFNVMDNSDDLVLVVTVKIESFDPTYFAIGGIFLVLIIISCCAARCCCRQSSSNKKASQPVQRRFDEYDNEPVGGQHNQLLQPARTRNSESSAAATGPLIHNPPPTANEPPVYSSVFTRAQQPDADADPLSSEPVPRFEVKGLNFSTSPLGSDSTNCEVYTSDKLNFL